LPVKYLARNKLIALVYYFRVGRPDAESSQDIVLSGSLILSEHCVLENRANEVVELKACEGALCYVNGKQIEEKTTLKSGDRVIFGKSHVFRFTNPEQARKEKKVSTPSSSSSSMTNSQMTDSMTNGNGAY
jgi:pSer/pThr/pTyr-binding forkhead associated (FHA) protein